jgi:hypothetical protein
MTLEQSLEEAKILKEILKSFGEKISNMPKFRESEVALRAETLRGFILIVQNDVYQMVREWSHEAGVKKGEVR